jgi:hypothetical protein
VSIEAMGIGRAIGYSLLALVDAVVPTVVVLAITGFTFLGRDLPGVMVTTVTIYRCDRTLSCGRPGTDFQ